MRILYILSGTGVRDGSTKSFLAMADSVSASGHEIAVVVPDGNGVTPDLRARGWEVLVVPYMFASLPYLSWSPRELIRFFPRLAMAWTRNRKARKTVNSFAKEWRPDIVHDNTSVTDLGYYAARKLNVPHLVHIREYGWRDFRRIIPGLRKRLSASGTYIAAITSDLAAFRGKGLDTSRLRVIYNGVVSATCIEYNSDKSPWFLYAGRIREAKGVADLLDAYVSYASAVKDRGDVPLGLKLAGACDDAAFFSSMRKRVSAANLDGLVEWLGERNDMETLFSRAAATVIPSKSEGFGRVMPEAMAAGSLCVARKEGGLAEQLENGMRECGRDIAFGYLSTEELADILSEIGESFRQGDEYKKGGRFYRMISDSRTVVSRLYSYEANARSIREYYAYILTK